MRRLVYLLLFTLSFVSIVNAQEYKPQEFLREVINEKGQGKTFESFIVNQDTVLKEIEKVLNNNIADTLFNRSQLRLYEFLKGFLISQDNQPLSEFPSPLFADYAVGYMTKLEAQRQVSEFIYGHVKNEIAGLLIPKDAHPNAKGILEALELLSRASVRIAVERDEILDIRTMVNYMDDPQIQKIITGLASVQNNAKLMDFTEVELLGNVQWLGEGAMQLPTRLSKSYGELMQPIDVNKPKEYHSHLLSLETFHNSYKELLSLAFESFLENRWRGDKNFAITDTIPLKGIIAKWKRIKENHFGISPEDAIIWLQSELKEDYFNFRLLLRNDLKLFTDSDSATTFLSRDNLKQLIEDVSNEWNDKLRDISLNLDTTRQSLGALVTLAVPKVVEDLLGEQLLRLDSLYLNPVLKQMNWDITQLDSLIISNEEKLKLKGLISQTINHFNQIKTIIKDPGILSEELNNNFELRSEWKGSDSIRYALYERFPSDTASTSFRVNLPTGISTPWIKIDKDIWSKKDLIFNEEWKTLVSQVGIQVNDELNKWLRSYGFPGSVILDNQNLTIGGGIHFQWLGREWELSLNETIELPNNDTIQITFGQIKELDFWENKSREIIKEEWTKAKIEHEHEIKEYWQLILADIDINLPDSLEGFLRGDSLIYSYDIGKNNPELSGARVDFKWFNNNWETSFNIPNVVLLERLESLLPLIEFKKTKLDGQIIETELWLNIGKNEPTYLGAFKISKSGQIDLIKENNSVVDISLSSDFQIRLRSPKCENNTWKWDVMIFQNLPPHLLSLKEFSALIGLQIVLLPSFQISIDFQGDVNKEKLLQAVASSLNTRGLLPRGVIVEDIVIGKDGIFPKLKIDPSLEIKYLEQVGELKTAIEGVALQVLRHPEIVEVGEKIEALYEEYGDIISNENINWLTRVINDPFDQVATDALITIARSNNNTVKLSEDGELKISYINNQINEISVFLKYLGCKNNSVIDFNLQGNKWIPKIQDCIRDQVRIMLNDGNVSLGSENLEFSIEEKKVILSMNAGNIPLEMYIYYNGKVSWNYSTKEVSDAILKPYLTEIEERGKNLLKELEIDATVNMVSAAKELLDQWEAAILKLGFKIENKEELSQILESSTKPYELTDTTLFAKLKATSGLIEGITFEDVKLKVANGLVPDFSASKANLDPIKEKINGLAGSIVELKDGITLSRGIITGSLNLKVPGFSDIPILLSIDLSKGKVNMEDWKDILLSILNNELNEKFLPYSLKNESVSIILNSSTVISTPPNNKVLEVKCVLNFSTGTAFDIPVSALLRIDLNSGNLSIKPENPDLKSLFIGVAGNFLDFLSVPFLEDNSWLTDVSLYPAVGIPQGVALSGEFSIWGVAKIQIPDLLVSQKGIRFKDNDPIRVTFGDGLRTPVPPIFELIEPSGEIQGTDLLFSAKLTLASNFEHLIYTKGSFRVDLKKPFRWETRNEVIALSMFNLGNSRQVIDLGSGTYEMEIDFGGPLKDIIALKGNGRVEASGPKINANGDLFFFGEKMATGDLMLNLANQTISANSKIDIPVAGSIDGHFSTGRGFSNPTVIASHSLSVLKFKLSNTKFLISPNIASAKFSVVGISMGLEVPSYKQLDKSAFEKLLKNLLSPDFSNLDEALFAILSGNITINPFSGFGPGGGGIGGKGGDGGGSGGSSGNGGAGGTGNEGYGGVAGVQSYSNNGNAQGMAAGTIQGNLLGHIPQLDQPQQDATVGNGTTPALVQGNYSFEIKKQGDDYRVFMSDSQKPGLEEAKSFISSEFVNEGHFISMGNGSYKSAGYFLNATDEYYVHVLKQKMNGSNCGDNNAVIHWYTGEKPDELKHIKMPLDDLKDVLGSLCFNNLAKSVGETPALGNWFQRFSSVVGNRAFELNSDRLIAQVDGSIFKFHAPEGTYAVAIRLYNSLNHTLIIGDNSGGNVLNIPNLNLIKANDGAQADLIRLARKHSNSGLRLFERDNTIYLFTGCDPAQGKEIAYKLIGSSFQIDNAQSKTCNPTANPPDSDPIKIEKEVGILIDTDLVGPGNCALEITHNNGNISLKCKSDSAPFAHAPVKHNNYTLFTATNNQWLPNDPNTKIWKLQYGLTRYLLNQGEAILWVYGSLPSEFDISELPLGKQGMPKWDKLNPVAYDNNVAIQGAFNQLCERVEYLLTYGSKIKENSIEFKENGDIAVFVVQFTNTDDTEYSVFVGNTKTQKSITLNIVSGAGSPMTFGNAFFNQLIHATR